MFSSPNAEPKGKPSMIQAIRPPKLVWCVRQLFNNFLQIVGIYEKGIGWFISNDAVGRFGFCSSELRFFQNDGLCHGTRL